MTTPQSIPPPPNRPDDDECCRRGCEPCIFDYYERALERWSDRVRTLGRENSVTGAPVTATLVGINPDHLADACRSEIAACGGRP